MKRTALAAIVALTACGGGTTSVNPTIIVPTAPPGGGSGALGVSTSQLSFTTAGSVLSFSATENGYTGTLTAANGTPSCAGIVTFAPASGSGPSVSFQVTAVAAGSCQVKVTDSGSQTAAVNVTVTTTGGTISLAH